MVNSSAKTVPPRAQPKASARIVRFGVYTFDLGAGELTKSGIRVRLQEQSFRVLRVFLERHGEVVTREELRAQVWPDTFVDFDFALNTTIRKIRSALRDSADAPRYIETLPKRGYRFIAPVEEVAVTPVNGFQSAAEPNGAQAPEPVTPEPIAAGRRRKAMAIGAAVALALTAGIGLSIWVAQPSPAPRVLSYVPITNDGERKGSVLASDGVRLYFSERSGIAQVSIAGGQPVSTVWPDFCLIALSPNGSEILAQSHSQSHAMLVTDDDPLWLLPVPTGSPRRLGISGHGGAWSPNGEKLAYANGSSLYLAKRDGSEPRKLVTVKGLPRTLQWSPDGSVLRFQVQAPENAALSVWQVSANGNDLRQGPPAGIGTRIANGSYSVFLVSTNSANELWAHRENAIPWRRGAGATRLTAGPLDFISPVASRDGKKIFAIGNLVRGQLQRYDSAAGQFRPYLSGISADGVTFSRDGQWIAYTTFPDFTLWRVRIDGSQRQQLTFAPQRAYFPRWSPDGRSIAYTIGYPLSEKRWKVYVMAAEGGTPQEVVAGDSDYSSPSWSPDGRSLAVGGVPWMKNWAPESTDIREYSLAARTAVKIPGSTGLWAPRWSPDGRYIVAETANSRGFMILDRASSQWSSLATVKDWIGYFCWSHDGQYLYFNLANEQSIYRIRLSDRRIELALRVKDFHVPDTTGQWFGLAPDDSFLLLRDVSVNEVYALDLEVR